MDERTPGQTTFRVMGPHERGRFAPEAWGHLLSLNGSGAINGVELEHIIERALMHFEGRIALDDRGPGQPRSTSGPRCGLLLSSGRQVPCVTGSVFRSTI